MMVAGGRPHYDLEERTFAFTKQTATYVAQLPMSITNREYAKQLVRAVGSVGANYIEANESLGRKDFLMKIRISRKEAKESRYWLKLTEPHHDFEAVRQDLVREATELMKIFGAILERSK